MRFGSFLVLLWKVLPFQEGSRWVSDGDGRGGQLPGRPSHRRCLKTAAQPLWSCSATLTLGKQLQRWHVSLHSAKGSTAALCLQAEALPTAEPCDPKGVFAPFPHAGCWFGCFVPGTGYALRLTSCPWCSAGTGAGCQSHLVLWRSRQATAEPIAVPGWVRAPNNIPPHPVPPSWSLHTAGGRQ